MSPAPSSTPTARRSVRRLLTPHCTDPTPSGPDYHGRNPNYAQDGSSRSEELRLRVLCPVPLVGAMIGRVRRTKQFKLPAVSFNFAVSEALQCLFGSQMISLCLQRGDNIKRLRRDANAEVVIEDFIVGSDERVMSVVLHRDAPHHTSLSGGDALVAVFDSFCELGRDCLTANNSSEEADAHSPNSDAEAQMLCNGVHNDDEYEIRLLVDSSRKWLH